MTAVYSSAGATLTHHLLEPATATLQKRKTTELPSVLQYGAVHPSGQFLYIVTTDSERGSQGVTGKNHKLCTLKIADDGSPAFYGEPILLRQRAIHTSVDRQGKYILIAYNAPPAVSVHKINEDGTIGVEIDQPEAPDAGFFSHQIQTTPSNEAAILVTRGHKPSAGLPQGNPGALKIYGFDQGRLVNRDSIAPDGSGYGYNPRHLAFHPSKPWAYVLVEFQNQLHMHRMVGDTLEQDPAFIASLTQHQPQAGILQVGGAIHVHPAGHVLYASNRVSATTHPNEHFPFNRGENNIAVFALDPETGRPSASQFVNPQGFHVRSFTLDSSGHFLIAATLSPMVLGDGQFVPAGLSVFRIAADGTLTFQTKYPVELQPGVQQMWVKAVAVPNP